MDKALTVFIWVWMIFAIVVNLVAVAGFFVAANSFWDGFGQVQDTYSPFNIFNWIAELILVSPAIGAAIWRDRRRSKRASI